MDLGIVIIVVVGVVVAWRAGAWWRHNKLAWGDHKTQKGKEQAARKYRWVTFRAALLAVVLMVVYLAVTGAISLVNLTKSELPTSTHSTPKPIPSCRNLPFHKVICDAPPSNNR